MAGVSDLLDGWLAKRFGWTSELGKWLDPIADKCLLVTVFVVAAWAGLVPRWLTAVVVARDVMIALGALTYLAWLGPLQGRPTFASKLNTLVQLAYLLGVLMFKAIGFPPVVLLLLGTMVTLVTARAVRCGLCDRVRAPRAQPHRRRHGPAATGIAAGGPRRIRHVLAAGQRTAARAPEGVARGDAPGVTWLAGPHASGKSHLLQATCALAPASRRCGYFPLAQLRHWGRRRWRVCRAWIWCAWMMCSWRPATRPGSGPCSACIASSRTAADRCSPRRPKHRRCCPGGSRTWRSRFARRGHLRAAAAG